MVLFCHLHPLPYKVLNYFVYLAFVKNFSNMYIKNVCTRRLLNLLCKSVLELFGRSRKKFIDEGVWKFIPGQMAFFECV